MKPTPLMHHNYAPFGRRALAFFLDNVIFSLMPLVFLVHGSARHQLIAVSIWILVAATIFEGLKGFSFGRYVTKTRLVDMHTGKHIGVVRDVMRSQLHMLELLITPWSFLRPLWNQHRLTFGDAICCTVVIDATLPRRGWEPLIAPKPEPTFTATRYVSAA